MEIVLKRIAKKGTYTIGRLYLDYHPIDRECVITFTIKQIGNALCSLFILISLSDAEMLEDIVQRFLAADLAAGDFAQFLQYHFQILGDDVAAHSHFH